MYRIALNWVDTGSVGVRPVNVFHVRAASATVSDIASVVGGALGTNGNSVFNNLYTGLEITSIQILPLDGTSAASDWNLPSTVHGSGAGGVLPQTCQVVSFHSAQRGSRGRGRMYIGPVGETQVNNGLITGSSQTTPLAGFGDFVDDMNADTPSTQLVVASYLHSDAHDVTNIRVDTVTGTQRGRVDQLR